MNRHDHLIFCAWSVVMPLLLLPLLCSCSDRGNQDRSVELFTVTRGTLDVTITESGAVEASESVSIKSRVSRTTRILEMIEEGTYVTEEDVANGRLLVRLDATELEETYRAKESDVESARASLTEAEEALLIQKSENESQIRSAELDLMLAMNDLRKLVGDTLAERYADKAPENVIALLDDPDLGGKSKQDLREYQSSIELEREELSRAQNTLKWTEKLAAKGYVTANDKEADALALRRRELSLQSATADLEIYRRYEFVKLFHQQWAAVLEAHARLEREKATARSKTAQAEAQHKSRQSRFRLENDTLQRIAKDIENCTITADTPGLVVLEQQRGWRSQEPLKVGSDVRTSQTIFEFPDVSKVVVRVDIHEAVIGVVSPGQKATIRVDAFPDSTFTGVVTKKAVMPSSQNRWLNPDLKMYSTEIAVDGQNERLRPGMTATVEILAERLADVLYVPIQTVMTDEDGNHYCYLADGRRTPVELGLRNQVFVVITKGLAEGSKILVSPPNTGSVGGPRAGKPRPDQPPGPGVAKPSPAKPSRPGNAKPGTGKTVPPAGAAPEKKRPRSSDRPRNRQG